MPRSKISIIIPFYKGEMFIVNLLDSLTQSLQSSKKKICVETVIVLDSFLSDITIEKKIYAYTDLNVKIISNNKNMGVAYSRSKGMEYATGDYITFIDQDDFVSIDYFRSLEDKLCEKVIDVIWMNGYLYFTKNDTRIMMFPIRPTFTLKTFIYNNVIPTPSFLIVKRERILKYNISFYQQDISDKIIGVDDWFFILQLLIKKTDDFVIEYVKSTNIFYCLHLENYSHNISKMTNSAANLLAYINSKYDLHSYKIKDRITTLFYMEYFYKDRIKAVLFHPFLFFKTLLFYLKDINRVCRLIIHLIKH
ncbi:glycosyltransferase family 2 protein [uncultured Bacteroides sp.]|jgi:putative glycosyltransferase|uniref:glycosyltransferase family 2 protein n=1 Tax=uncultured Bacteroides sp. TaxID=162156 RepID=UPI00280C2931|nr:glycosyltransferase family 2 protein [uncultured Bacteroides sp.]